MGRLDGVSSRDPQSVIDALDDLMEDNWDAYKDADGVRPGIARVIFQTIIKNMKMQIYWRMKLIKKKHCV